MAFYDLASFQNICGTKSKHSDVVLVGDVLRDAQMHYGLQSKEDVLFSVEDSLHNFNLDCSIPWRQNPKPEFEIMIDSYNCLIDRDNPKNIYFAFMFVGHNKKWAIKSFHPSNNSGCFENKPFSNLLSKQKRNG